jgi:hypothetical protein
MSHSGAMRSTAVHDVPQLTDRRATTHGAMLGALPMPLSFKDVAAIASELPGVTVGAKWNHKTWLVGDRGFIWERPLNKVDLGRLGDAAPPEGDILGVRVENLDAKDALLAMELPGFFTIEHFKNYPGLLIELRKARKKDLRAAIVDAHRVAIAAAPKAKTKRARALPRPRQRARRR